MCPQINQKIVLFVVLFNKCLYVIFISILFYILLSDRFFKQEQGISLTSLSDQNEILYSERI